MKRRKRNDNAHCHDRTAHLDQILLERGSACHWCRRPIVRVRSLKKAGLEILVDAHFDVTWTTATGARATVSKATLDHVVPLARGGGRTRANLVAACARCNHDRNSLDQPKTATPKTWRDRHPVPDDERELGGSG